MKRNPIPDHIKTAVAQRANFKCEYCLLSDIVSFYNFHIDRIKSIKHGGLSHIDNLAYCCPDWHEHFYLEDGLILCKTDIANVTEPIFKFNDLDRLIYRRQLIHLNHYP